MKRRTAALRAVHQVNADHDRAATCRDISQRARMSHAVALDHFHGLIGAGLTESDGRGVWLTEKGVQAMQRDRPLRVPADALCVDSDLTD